MDHRKRSIQHKRTIGRKMKPNFGKDMWGDVHFCLAQIMQQLVLKAAKRDKKGNPAQYMTYTYMGTMLQLRREVIRLLNVIDHYLEEEKDFISWK